MIILDVLMKNCVERLQGLNIPFSSQNYHKKEAPKFGPIEAKNNIDEKEKYEIILSPSTREQEPRFALDAKMIYRSYERSEKLHII